MVLGVYLFWSVQKMSQIKLFCLVWILLYILYMIHETVNLPKREPGNQSSILRTRFPDQLFSPLFHVIEQHHNWRTITLGYENISPLSLFLERSKIGCKSVCVCERERQTDRERQGEGDEVQKYTLENCYIDLFLNHVVIPYSEPYERFLTGVRFGPLYSLVAPRAAFTLTLLSLELAEWDSVTLWMTTWRGYLCIYYFIKPTNYGSDSCELLPLVNPCAMSSCLQAGTYCPSYPWLVGSVLFSLMYKFCRNVKSFTIFYLAH